MSTTHHLPNRSAISLRAVVLAGLLVTVLAPHAANAQGLDGRRMGGALFGDDEEKDRKADFHGPSTTATDELVSDIRIEGNSTIASSAVLSQLSTRRGRPYDPKLVQADVKKLASLSWFLDVRTREERTAAGLVVVFRVVERPTMRYVEYLGTSEIRPGKIARETGLKAGGAIDPFAIEEGRRKILELYRSNGFNRVQVTILEGLKPGDKGVTYVINEGPKQKVWDTEFEGNEFATDGQLKTKIKSKHGFMRIFKGYIDPEQLDSDVDALVAYYRSFGFFQAKVGRMVEYNEEESWATVRFVIHEGTRYQVRNVQFAGNTLFATESLAQGVKLTDGLPFEQGKLNADTEWLKDLYGSRGYVFADINAEPRFLEEPGLIDLVYNIEEGERFRVGRVFVTIGGDDSHTKIQTALNRISLRPGEILDIRQVKASERRLQASGLFLTDAQRGIYPKITFQIPELEDEELVAAERGPTRGQSPDQQASVPLPPVQPIAVGTDGSRTVYEVQRPESLHGDGGVDVYLDFTDPNAPVATPVPATPAPAPSAPQPATPTTYQGPVAAPSAYSQPVAPVLSQPVYHTTRKPWDEPNTGGGAYDELELTVRGQSPAPGMKVDPWVAAGANDLPAGAPRVAQVPAPATTPYPAWSQTPPPAANPPTVNPAYSGVVPVQYQQPGPANPGPGGFAPAPTATPNAGVLPYPTMPAPSGGLLPYPTDPQGQFIGPPAQAFADPTADVFVDLRETQTGRFLLGVGVNSDAGVVGQIMLDEQNFDWRRPPSSFQDVIDGKAWRGGGQHLRLEAAPGTQVSRYLFSWQEPYWLDTPVSLGLSGSYFERRYRDWDEERLGGRVSLGYQWVDSDVTARVAYRGEQVSISNAANPGLPELAEVLGDNMLHGFRLTVTNDTRDNPFLATQGHFLEGYAEQVVGSFDYPRLGIDARKYFLMHERPDHTGRHVLAASTRVEWTGDNTPVYEHFFAGGFSTMRGFDFRGASPVKSGVEVGGEFMWLNTVEYMFPITADDMLHGVVFCDFGTVEQEVEINDLRVSPGFGLRITVPAMGPAPIALDFAFPVSRADTDDLQVFSFSVGFMR